MSPANPGRDKRQDAATLNPNGFGPLYVASGSGGGGWYGGGGGSSGSVGISTTSSTYLSIPAASEPRLLNGLNSFQIAKLMREHSFVELDGTDFCMLCYAFDSYRRRIDHEFIIQEE